MDSWTPQLNSVAFCGHHGLPWGKRPTFRCPGIRSIYFVLDALANDLESFDDVLRLVNDPTLGWAAEHGRTFTAEDIESALIRLIRDRLVEAYDYATDQPALVALGKGVLPAGKLDDFYFGLTEHGRTEHAAWEAPGKSASG